MPVSIEHEAPLELLERFPDLLPNLLRDQLGRPVPLGARLRPVSENHNITVAQEFRSDSAVVLEIASDQPPACAAIVEPQRSIDPDKWYSWPRYLSDLHHKYRCPTYLIVFALGDDADAVGAWARQPIATFQPGSNFAPLVVGPPEVPPPATVEAAKADLPRAALGTLLHLSGPDGTAVAHRTLRAVYELHGLDMFVWMYYLIRGIARDERFAEIERLIMLDAQTHFIPKTAFERELYAKAKSEARAEVRAEAKAEAVLAVLAARGLAVTADQRNRLLTCTDAAKLDRLVAGAVSAPSVAGLLADL
jgi:hypothetical protein